MTNTRTIMTLFTLVLVVVLSLPPQSPAQPKMAQGPALLLRAGVVDASGQTVTMPLQRGRMADGRTVWYVMTDVSDAGIASQRRLNHSPKLGNALTGKGPRLANRGADGTLVFDAGTVDFAPLRLVVPGPAAGPFPPKTADPGSIADAAYTPLLRVQQQGGVVYNAPVLAFDVDAARLAFCDGRPDYNLVHDRVVKICPERGTVTLGLTRGFSTGRPVLYVSTEASDRGVAAMEGATYAPRLSDAAPTGGYGEHSQVELLLAVINGPRGAANPRRQGLESALLDGGGPLNVIGAVPTLGAGYSPLWSVNLGRWSATAIARGRRSRVTDLAGAMRLASAGWITGAGGKALGPAGIIVNCPVVQRLQ